MKTLISVIIGIAAFIGILYLDSMLIDYVMTSLAFQSHDMAAIARVAFWIILIVGTGGVSVFIASLIGILIRAILD